MDQNHGDTPNPLNSSLETKPIDAAPQKVDATTREISSTPQIVGATPQALVTEVKSQHRAFKKKSLIVGGIVAAFVALGCGVVAALLLLNHHEDPVNMAVQKLMEGGYSKNVAIDGTIEMDIKDKNSDLTSLRIDLDSTIVGESAVNSTNATIIANIKNSAKPVKFDINEVYSNAGDLYFKIDNLGTSMVVDCQGEAECSVTDDSADILESIDDVLEVIDGEWIRIPASESSQLFNEIDEGGTLSCATSFVGNINNGINSLATIYKNNPFAFSSDENIPIARKDSQVYRVMIDSERFTKFANSVQELEVIDNLLSCAGYGSESLGINSLKNLPPLYVEVNDQYQFTRLYFEYEDNNIAMTIDLGLDYPDKPVITEPVEYQDFDILMQSLDVYEEDMEVEITSD